MPDTEPDFQDPDNDSPTDEGDDWGDSIHLVKDQAGGSTVLPSPREPRSQSVTIIEGIHEEHHEHDHHEGEDGSGDEHSGQEEADESVVTRLDVREYKGSKRIVSGRNRPDVTKMARKDGKIVKTRKGGLEIENSEWTRKEKVKTKWVVLLTVGVIAVITGSLALLPWINEINQQGSPEKVMYWAESLQEMDHAEITEALLVGQEEAASIFSSFITAKVADDFLPMVWKREEVEPLIRASTLGGTVGLGWNPDSSVEWQIITTNRVPCAMLKGVLSNYQEFTAYFVYEDGQLLMDWKGTTGFSTASYKELVEGRGDASEIRGTMTPSVFYTDAYPESEYQSYQLVEASGVQSVWCYVKRESSLDVQIRRLFIGGNIVRQEVEPQRVVVSLGRSADGALPNQWLIERFLCEQWVLF